MREPQRRQNSTPDRRVNQAARSIEWRSAVKAWLLLRTTDVYRNVARGKDGSRRQRPHGKSGVERSRPGCSAGQRGCGAHPSRTAASARNANLPLPRVADQHTLRDSCFCRDGRPRATFRLACSRRSNPQGGAAGRDCHLLVARLSFVLCADRGGDFIPDNMILLHFASAVVHIRIGEILFL